MQIHQFPYDYHWLTLSAELSCSHCLIFAKSSTKNQRLAIFFLRFSDLNSVWNCIFDGWATKNWIIRLVISWACVQNVLHFCVCVWECIIFENLHWFILFASVIIFKNSPIVYYHFYFIFLVSFFCFFFFFFWEGIWPYQKQIVCMQKVCACFYYCRNKLFRKELLHI